MSATVLDRDGQRLSPCARDRALALVAAGRAELVSASPLTIRLPYAVSPRPERRPATPETPDYEERPLLLHICCGPCATYTVARLRALRWHVEGLWHNPNVHPRAEHDRRRESLDLYARQVALPMHWADEYDVSAFLEALAGRERPGERCVLCYRLRLARTARAAREGGFAAITTTLLISPYQDQAAIRRIGEEVAAAEGVAFYYENLRRGFAEHYALARRAGLYLQDYCGCLFSARERAAALAARRSADAALLRHAG